MKKLLLLSIVCFIACTHNVIPTVYVPKQDTNIVIQGTPGPKGDKGDKPIAGIDYPIPTNGKDAPIPIGDPSQPFPQIQVLNQDGTTKVVSYFSTIVEVNVDKHYRDSTEQILQNEIDAYRAAKAEKYHRHNVSDIDGTINTGSTGTVDQLFSIKSVKDFGAKGDGITDDYQSIQNGINSCIANNIATLFFPTGRYKISKPLILQNGNGFVNLSIIGEGNLWNPRSIIIPTFTNTFALGIQKGKGCKIKGLTFMGKFQPPFQDDMYKFFNSTFESFTDGICRDSRYSPYAAIVIDPFTNTQKYDSALHYPSLSANYALGGYFNSGSSGITITYCGFYSFVVGVCSSPNGETRNAEGTQIRDCYFERMKLAISGGQDQEKNNSVYNCYWWGSSHTFFASGYYGDPRMAGNWNIDMINIAGGDVRFIHNEQHGYFPTYISHIYGELLGVFGEIKTELACTIRDCPIDFAPGYGYKPVIECSGNVVFDGGSNFRYYTGQKYPIIVNGGTYIGTTFEGPPVDISGNAEYIRCFDGANTKIGETRKNLPYINGYTPTFYRYGDFSIGGRAYQSNTTFLTYSPDNTLIINNKFTSSQPLAYNINSAIYLGDISLGQFAFVTDITGNIVTLGWTVIPAGSYKISTVYPNKIVPEFTGDIVGNEILNPVITWGDGNFNYSVGNVYQTEYGVFKITGYNNGRFQTVGTLPPNQNGFSFK